MRKRVRDEQIDRQTDRERGGERGKSVAVVGKYREIRTEPRRRKFAERRAGETLRCE